MNSNHNFESLDDDLLEEYDLSQLSNMQRGQYAQRLDRGYSVTVYDREGSKTRQYAPLDESMIVLESDIRRYFSDSKSVNEILRSLINFTLK